MNLRLRASLLGKSLDRQCFVRSSRQSPPSPVAARPATLTCQHSRRLSLEIMAANAGNGAAVRGRAIPCTSCCVALERTLHDLLACFGCQRTHLPAAHKATQEDKEALVKRVDAFIFDCDGDLSSCIDSSRTGWTDPTTLHAAGL